MLKGSDGRPQPRSFGSPPTSDHLICDEPQPGAVGIAKRLARRRHCARRLSAAPASNPFGSPRETAANFSSLDLSVRRPEWPLSDPVTSFDRVGAAAAMQRKEPVASGRRTHGTQHQADIRSGRWRWPERQLYEVLLTFPPRHHVWAAPTAAQLACELELPTQTSPTEYETARPEAAVGA